MDKLKNAVDEAKSTLKQKIGTDAEKKIEEALSNKNWGASTTLLNDLSSMTSDYESYNLIMKKLWEALDGEGRQWRTIFKALTLLDHLIKNGTERVVENARDHMFKIRSLSSFNYNDGVSGDKGTGIRDKAKSILDMLNDNDKIREEREKSRRLKDKYIGIGKNGGSGYAGDSYSSGSGYNSSAHDDQGRYKYTNSYDSPTTAVLKNTEDVTSDDSDEEEARAKRRAERKARKKRDKEEREKAQAALEESDDEEDNDDFSSLRSSGKQSPAAVAIPSLLDDDFFSAGTAASVSSTSFDPLSSGSQSTSTLNEDIFGDFSSPIPPPQQPQAVFNPFSPSSGHQQQPQLGGMGMGMGMQPQQQQQQSVGGMMMGMQQNQLSQSNLMMSGQSPQPASDPFSSFQGAGNPTNIMNGGIPSSYQQQHKMSSAAAPTQRQTPYQQQQPQYNMSLASSSSKSSLQKHGNEKDAWGSGLFDLDGLKANEQNQIKPNSGSIPNMAGMGQMNANPIGMQTGGSMGMGMAAQYNNQNNTMSSMQQGSQFNTMGMMGSQQQFGMQNMMAPGMNSNHGQGGMMTGSNMPLNNNQPRQSNNNNNMGGFGQQW